jgi:hypothetical protein
VPDRGYSIALGPVSGPFKVVTEGEAERVINHQGRPLREHMLLLGWTETAVAADLFKVGVGGGRTLARMLFRARDVLGEDGQARAAMLAGGLVAPAAEQGAAAAAAAEDPQQEAAAAAEPEQQAEAVDDERLLSEEE